MKRFGLKGWNGWEDKVEGCEFGRLVNEWMKEGERSSLAHTLKGGGKEEVVEDM